MIEKSVRDELENICYPRDGKPLWPGSTLSHATANECERRGWARRVEGGFLPTAAGILMNANREKSESEAYAKLVALAEACREDPK